MKIKSKNFCITTFVFGEKYQDYIPLFIYSIKMAYPDYNVTVFVHKKLKKNIQEQIDSLRCLGDFKIIDNYYSEIDFEAHPQHGKALRWILWDDSFNNYDAIYIGDIDIFYCKEKTSILEQHLIHCQTIQKPFSNVKRKSVNRKWYNVRNLLITLKNTSVPFTIKKLLFGNYVSERLSGLHFFLTKEYFNMVKPNFTKYEDTICTFSYILHHLNGFQNESFLYDMMVEAGWDNSIPEMTSDKELLMNSPDQPVFRPHHGIHLGIFRDTDYSDSQIEILNTPVYKEYYKQFCSLEDENNFKQISSFFTAVMQKEIKNMHTYYNQ